MPRGTFGKNDGSIDRRTLANQARHGHASGSGESAEYQCWTNMKARCADKNRKDFKYYGALGITVCKRWMLFENFLADMGERPSAKHTIERKQVTLGYGPDNCKWATHAEQQLNRSDNVSLEFRGETLCIAELVRRFGVVARSTFAERMRQGWTIEDALTKPQIFRHLTPDQRAEICRLRALGMKQRDIAVKIGVAQPCISTVLKNANTQAQNTPE